MTTRRKFIFNSAKAAGFSLCASRFGHALSLSPADVTLRISSINFEVKAGHIITTTAYNGSVPGPLIRLREGTPVTVDIFNDTDATEWVHWHGQTIPAEVDGAEEEKSLTVPAHGHLRYQFVPGPSGVRYLHSHAMAGSDLTRGTYSGQFSFVFVEAKQDPGLYDQEVFLATHEWEPFFTTDETEEIALSTDPIQRLREEEALRQRQMHPGVARENWEVGYRVCSINGKALGRGEPVLVKEGQRILFHILNASATENVRLALPGHRFNVIALDGNPVPHPQDVEVLYLGTGERISAIVRMNMPGVWILGSLSDLDRENGLGVVVEYAGRTDKPQWIDPAPTMWDYTIFGKMHMPREPVEIIPLVIERALPDPAGFERWAINGKSFHMMNEPTVLHKGRLYRLVFDNRSGEAHPLHLHRHTFELIDVYGKSTSGIKKDVVLVKSFRKTAVDFTPEQTGLTLFHCHNQLHMDYGFRLLFKVV